uniref:Nudix hydrolase domain-containing protein n=1 Tax=viral metagenome TaxID=1070528 RepID=A0A6C0KHD8_9ZZZZ
MYQNFKCSNKCCNYTITPYQDPYSYYPSKSIDSKIKKAGSFMYDKQNNKILLVQSRGQLWGPPKGSIQDNENPLECALREVKEETGIEIKEAELNSGSITIKTKALYYFMEVNMDKYNVEPQIHVKDNDANGIGWFNVDCLNELIDKRHISINQHCRILIKRIFNKDIVFNASTQKRRLLQTIE